MSYGIGPDCVDCGVCIPACPRGAIHPTELSPIPLVVDPLACNDCGSCERVCPERAVRIDPAWPVCRGRGCPLTSRRYSCWACTESRITCVECGGPLWKGPDDSLWRCPACEIEGRVSCPKLRKYMAGLGGVPEEVAV